MLNVSIEGLDHDSEKKKDEIQPELVLSLNSSRILLLYDRHKYRIVSNLLYSLH